MRKSYLPRNRRVAPKDKPGMSLTSRDQEIIRAVNDYRILTAAHIEALFFTSRSAAQYRLVRLYQHGFLNRQFVPIPTGSTATIPPLYTVGKYGAQVLIDECGYDPDQVQVTKKDFAWGFVAHTLKINEVRIAIVSAIKQLHWTLETWEGEREFRAAPDYVTLSSETGSQEEKPVLPDGYFRIMTPKGRAHFFIEVDRGREPESRFKPQIEVYEEYVASGGYEQRYNTKSLRILIVTTTPRRMQKLKRITRNAAGDKKYCFTTFEQISPETVLTHPIWQRLGSETPYALVP